MVVNARVRLYEVLGGCRGAIRPRKTAPRGRKPALSVLNPKFAALRSTCVANFGFKRTLENYDSSVVLVRQSASRT